MQAMQEVQGLRELSADELSQVGGGVGWLVSFFRSNALGAALEFAADAVWDYHSSGAAAEFQLNAGAGTFG